MGTPISDGPKPAHKLKRLEIFHYRFYRSDFETVAVLTGGCLESVVCILSDENFTPWDMPPEEKIEIITDFFQENSKDTLARDKISVIRSFRGFFDDFRFSGTENMVLLSEINQTGGGGPDGYDFDWFYGVEEDEEDDEYFADENER